MKFKSLLVAMSIILCTAAIAEEPHYDLVVVEATPAGITMAVRAAREGLSVLLVNHTTHLGGILSSGLGVWDSRYEGRRAPIYDEVRWGIFDYYRTKYGADSTQYHDALPGEKGHTNGKFEAHVMEKILTGLVAREKGITVLRGYFPVSAERNGSVIEAVTFHEMDGTKSTRISAKIFADCSYEGDLIPLVGAQYRVGREARAEFGEPHAGVIYMAAVGQPETAEQARAGQEQEKLHLRPFPGFERMLPESTGAVDGNVQAYNYRTLLTSDPANRIPAAKPKDYDPGALRTLDYTSVVQPIANAKVCWNRPQLAGSYVAYVEGNWATRKRVMDQTWHATVAMLWFLQHDESIPADVRRTWGQLGFAEDEFGDNGHRPYEIYVREARRLVGRYIFTEHDALLSPGLRRAPVHADSISVTEWYMDCHACATDRVPGSFYNGVMHLGEETFPGEIPYQALLPKGLDNVLVPVCLSATHVAWGTVRLEPTMMNIAESAAFAAVQAVRRRVFPSAIDVDQLVRTLAENRVMVSFFKDVNVAGNEDWIPGVEYFGAKGFFPDYEARMGDPLGRGTAEIWAAAFQRIRLPGYDAQKIMRDVSEREAQDHGKFSRSDFLGSLQMDSGTASTTPSESISRGDAVTMMWNQLKRERGR